VSVSAIVLGTSWGGLRALQTLLAGLRGLPCPLLIAQHRAAGESPDLASMLARSSALPVIDAADKEPLIGGRVYLAPADYHLMVEERGITALSTMPPVNSARPSIDVLFETAAAAYGPDLAGVVLTGASADGAAGLARIQAAGGVAIVQQPATAECAIMPKAALAATGTRAVYELESIPRELLRLAGQRVA
jgi:two-component system chemotaxis response regulator CheB